jgi:hypothetical protein
LKLQEIRRSEKICEGSSVRAISVPDPRLAQLIQPNAAAVITGPSMAPLAEIATLLPELPALVRATFNTRGARRDHQIIGRSVEIFPDMPPRWREIRGPVSLTFGF